MHHTSLIRTSGFVALVLTATFSMTDANARGGFGGGFHGGGFHGGGFSGYHSASFRGYRGYGHFTPAHGYRGAHVAASRGRSFLVNNISNPLFATGF